MNLLGRRTHEGNAHKTDGIISFENLQVNISNEKFHSHISHQQMSLSSVLHQIY